MEQIFKTRSTEMKLTIHGVERLQQRTGLRLDELRLLFSRGAFVHLGSAKKYGRAFQLFYDDQKRNWFVACTDANTLISILEMHHNLPPAVRMHLTQETKDAAREIFYQKMRARSSDSTTPISILLKVTSREVVHTRTQIRKVAPEGYKTASKQQMLEICLDEIFRISRILRDVHAVDIRTMWFEISFVHASGHELKRFLYKGGQIHNLVNQIKIESMLLSLTALLRISHNEDVFTYDLGSIPVEEAQSDNRVIRYFKEPLKKAWDAMHAAGLFKKGTAIFSIYVLEAESGQQLRKIYRDHKILKFALR